MKKKFLKKIIAQSEQDLQFVSACCSDGLVEINEIKYLPKNKIFLLSIERFSKETNDKNIRINSIIRFDYVGSSKSKNISQTDEKSKIKLLAIDLFKKPDNYEITLLFSNNRFISLVVEIIEVTLEDLKVLDD
jgi:hypothetical protein|tara:strand:+ start:1281 stop:1679 length:399 start_codon:yes stop_codon:yes gene_type:complete